MLSDHSEEPMTESPFRYTLRAAVTHYGSHGNGHYVAYRPAPIVAQKQESEADNVAEAEKIEQDLREQWWRFSDDSVYAISEEQAHQGNVFMLFYEHIDESDSVAYPSLEGDVVEMLAVPEDALLPPTPTSCNFEQLDIEALSIPLPGSDDIEDFVAPQIPPQEVPPPLLSSYPTPPPEDMKSEQAASRKHEELEHSEAESEDAPSSYIISDSEVEVERQPTPKPFVPISPQMMRTAGNAASRGQGKRPSLPLVSAT